MNLIASCMLSYKSQIKVQEGAVGLDFEWDITLLYINCGVLPYPYTEAEITNAWAALSSK